MERERSAIAQAIFVPVVCKQKEKRKEPKTLRAQICVVVRSESVSQVKDNVLSREARGSKYPRSDGDV